MTQSTRRVLHCRSKTHLSREREDFKTDYDTRWSSDDEREWEDLDRDGDCPEEDDE